MVFEAAQPRQYGLRQFLSPYRSGRTRPWATGRPRPSASPTWPSGYPWQRPRSSLSRLGPRYRSGQPGRSEPLVPLDRQAWATANLTLAARTTMMPIRLHPSATAWISCFVLCAAPGCTPEFGPKPVQLCEGRDWMEAKSTIHHALTSTEDLPIGVTVPDRQTYLAYRQIFCVGIVTQSTAQL